METRSCETASVITFSDLYDRRADYIYFLCSRLEMDQEKCELLFQDAWRRIHRFLPQLETLSEERWLCAKLIESHRRLQRSLRSGAGEDRLDGTSDQVRLAQSLMGLDLEHRWPLVLREYAGFDYEEIAWILSLPTGTVKARLARARGQLRQLREGGAQ